MHREKTQEKERRKTRQVSSISCQRKKTKTGKFDYTVFSSVIIIYYHIEHLIHLYLIIEGPFHNSLFMQSHDRMSALSPPHPIH